MLYNNPSLDKKHKEALEWLGTRYQQHPEHKGNKNTPKISSGHLQHKWRVKREYEEPVIDFSKGRW